MLPGEDPGSGPGARWKSSRPGPHLDQNVLGELRCGIPASILGLSGGLFSAARMALSAAQARPGRQNDGSSHPQQDRLLHPWHRSQPRVAFAFHTDSRTLSADAKRSESPRWR